MKTIPGGLTLKTDIPAAKPQGLQEARATGATDSRQNAECSALPKIKQLSVCVLASGSKGNAIYVSDGQTALLLDAGLSAREIEARMAVRGLSPQALTAILVTHHHGDHVRGIGPMSRRYGLPVYTLPVTQRHCNLGTLQKVYYFDKGGAFRINSFNVHAFDTPHDAADSVGFTLTSGGVKIGVATDLGVITNPVREHLRGCHFLVLEANHDMEMLLNGPYPWHLKQRVKSREGHLSNAACGEFLAEIMHDSLEHVIFAHLSETNNTPQKVHAVMAPLFSGHKTKFTVAAQAYPTEIIVIKTKD